MLQQGLHFRDLVIGGTPDTKQRLGYLAARACESVVDDRLLAPLVDMPLGQIAFETSVKTYCRTDSSREPYGCHDAGHIYVRGFLEESEYRTPLDHLALVTPQYGATIEQAVGIALVHEIAHYIEDFFLTSAQENGLRDLKSGSSSAVTLRAGGTETRGIEYFAETVVAATVLPEIAGRDPIGVAEIDKLLTVVAGDARERIRRRATQ